LKPSMGMSIQRQMSQLDNSDRRMDMNHQMSNMRDMFMNNQEMASNMMNPSISRNMMGQEVRSIMGSMHGQNQVVVPNQYIKKDNMGNYVFAYDDQLTKRKEEGNNRGDVKGQYTYTMPNGLQRQVDFVADNNGFHVRDNADPARIKRSSEPDLVQTQMTSVMDSSLRDDGRDMLRMSNMIGTERDIKMMGMDQQRYSNIMMGKNMMGQDSMGRNLMDQDSMGHNMMSQDSMGGNLMRQGNMGQNMMGRNIYNIMTNRGMTSDMSNMMGQQMKSSMMSRDSNMKMMGHNIMGQDRTSQLMSRNMMGRQNMTPNMMYSNIMGQDMTNMALNQMSSNVMDSNNSLMGQRIMQQMEMERIPETYTSARMF